MGTVSRRQPLQPPPFFLSSSTASPRRTTTLRMSKQQDRDEDDNDPMMMKGINLKLIGLSLLNQIIIGSTIWTGGPGYDALATKADFGPSGILLGLAGVVPMLALSRSIETSESPYVAGLNLSTNMAVLRLFGAAPQPVLALFFSILMATVTGVVEEVTFRGMLLPNLAEWLGQGDIWVGVALSTALFAFLHTNPTAFFKGGEATVDNLVLFVLQCINGAFFALLYLTTGNLAVPIVTHALYDLYTFYKTHTVDVAGQMDYAERNALMPVCKSRSLEQKWSAARGERFVRQAKQSFYLMDTNRDGVLSRKELRVALFSYGINLSALQSARVASAADLDASGGIDFDEFLEYLGPTGGKPGKAVRNTLFGPI